MQTDSDLVIRHATVQDGPAMLALLPRLAAFDVPQRRSSEELWRGDERVLQRWLAGAEADCIVLVALGSGGGLLGATLARLRPELLSGEPSAHLEILVVAREAEGRGIGTALIQETESVVYARGARSMTLHVFAANDRARRLYKTTGYDGEILRYIKELTSLPDTTSR